MEIKYLKLIKTIAEEGNIANSSQKLFLTQSALSHQLKELEKQLNFKVFHRSKNKWELTEEGTELYKLSKTVLKNIDDTFKNIEHLKLGSSGNIKVSTECYSFYQGLPLFIQKMGVLYPQINVDLILEATHKPIDKLISNEIDIAITSTKPTNNSLISYELFSDEVYAIIHKENPLNNLKYIEASQFSNLHLIIHSYPLETVSVFEHFLKPNNITPKQVSAIPLTEVSMEMINTNFGITCMPKWALKNLKISKNLNFKSLGKKGLKRTHYLVIRKSDIDKKYINDFILNFKDEFINQQN